MRRAATGARGFVTGEPRAPALHPIVDLAARLLVVGTDEPLAYPPGAGERITQALLDAKDAPEIADVVLSLFHAAIALSEEEGAPQAAAVVLRALHAAREGLAIGEAESAALAAKLEAGLERATKRAPMIDAKAPEGTFKASRLPPPRKFRG